MTKYLKPKEAAKYLGVNVRIRRVGGNKAMIARPQNPQIDLERLAEGYSV